MAGVYLNSGYCAYFQCIFAYIVSWKLKIFLLLNLHIKYLEVSQCRCPLVKFLNEKKKSFIFKSNFRCRILDIYYVFLSQNMLKLGSSMQNFHWNINRIELDLQVEAYCINWYAKKGRLNFRRKSNNTRGQKSTLRLFVCLVIWKLCTAKIERSKARSQGKVCVHIWIFHCLRQRSIRRVDKIHFLRMWAFLCADVVDNSQMQNHVCICMFSLHYFSMSSKISAFSWQLEMTFFKRRPVYYASHFSDCSHTF